MNKNIPFDQTVDVQVSAHLFFIRLDECGTEQTRDTSREFKCANVEDTSSMWDSLPCRIRNYVYMQENGEFNGM